jgi:FkbM family methyltransferase
MTVKSDVRSAYRWILGREADPTGFATYAQMLSDGVLDHRSFRNLLLNSKEFIETIERRDIVQLTDDIVVVVNPNEDDFGYHIATTGEWEAHVARTVRRLMPRGGVFVDVGANVGVMSFHAAAAAGRSGRVISFEPNSLNAANFRRGILANGFTTIRLYQFALSDHEEMLTISSGSNSGVIADEGALSAGGEVVQAVRGDSLLFNEERVDLIKMDIEGFEPFALRGLQETIARCRPKIICEFNPRCLRTYSGIDPAAFAEELYAMGGTIGIIDDEGDTIPCAGADELMALWQEKDRRCTETGDLPAGMAHFDLVISP